MDLGEWVLRCCWVSGSPIPGSRLWFLVICMPDVSSDAPSFEMAPLVGPHNARGGIWAGEEWEDEMQGGGLLHQWLLGGWGLMIGEMWDLDRLCEKAEQLGRWTCFVSSVPLKVSWRLRGDDGGEEGARLIVNRFLVVLRVRRMRLLSFRCDLNV